MIIGIGCDLVEQARIENLVTKYNKRFIEKIFSPEEIEKANKYRDIKTKYISHLAKRFSAKEAFSKALGSGIGQYISFRQIEIANDQLGKPFIITNKAIIQSIIKLYSHKYPFISQWKYNDALNKISIHLSMSDDAKHAMAYVIIELTNSGGN